MFSVLIGGATLLGAGMCLGTGYHFGGRAGMAIHAKVVETYLIHEDTIKKGLAKTQEIGRDALDIGMGMSVAAFRAIKKKF
jgi:hypothetical protein